MSYQNDLDNCDDDDDVRELVERAGEDVNSQSEGADGNYGATLHSPDETHRLGLPFDVEDDDWVVDTGGSVGRGTDNDGNALFDEPEPQRPFVGKSAKKAAKKFFDALKDV